MVATHNRADLLPRLIAALEAETVVGGFEVVIVDDASTDHTWDELGRLETATSLTLRVHRLASNAGPATARNVGWRAAQAPLVVFTDDDCEPQPGWLAAMVEGLERLDVVQGHTEWNPAQHLNHGPFCRSVEVRSEEGFYQTCNIGYRRSLLEQLGGFDEHYRLPAGEDTDLGWRAREAGASSGFADDALVFHDVRPSSFVAHLKDTRRWVTCVRTVRDHPGLRDLIWRRVFLRASHPAALLGGVGLVVAALPVSGLIRLLGLGLLLPYVDLRVRRWPLMGGPRRRVAAIPFAFVADLAESLLTIGTAIRYRTFVL